MNIFINIILSKVEKIVFIAASDKPKILKLTFLQLILASLSCVKSSSFEVEEKVLLDIQDKDS